MPAPSAPWMRAFHRRELPEPTTTNAKDFADSVNARVVMPTKSLLDESRDCEHYFKTDVAATFKAFKTRQMVNGWYDRYAEIFGQSSAPDHPAKQPLRRAK